MKACYIGDPDNNHDGPNITTMFGLSFRKMEWRDVSELGERELRKLAGNKHFTVGEEAGAIPMAKPIAAGASAEPIVLEIAPDVGGEQLIIMRSGDLGPEVQIKFTGPDAEYSGVLLPGMDMVAAITGLPQENPDAGVSEGGDTLVVPDDWRTAHHKKRMAWAKQIKGSAVANAQEADHVISQYRGEDAEDDFSELDPDD